MWWFACRYPGFASLDANKICRIPPEELQHAFPEFEPYFGQCRFTGCSHRSEKGCAVRAALEEGKLSGYTLSELPDHVRGSQPVKGVGTLMQDLTKRAVILSAMPVTPALSAYLQPGIPLLPVMPGTAMRLCWAFSRI